MIPLPSKWYESYLNQTNCNIFKRKFEGKYTTDTSYRKVRNQFHFTGKYRGITHTISNFKFRIPKEIPVFFHNGSNYNHNFIIKELAKEFAKKFNCLGENNKKYESLQFQKQKTKRIDRYEKSEELYLNLSNLDGNLAEEIHKIKYKNGYNNGKCEIRAIKYKDCECCLKYTYAKDELIEYKCLCCS